MEYRKLYFEKRFSWWKIVYGIEDNLDLFNRFNDLINRQDMLN